MKSMKTRNILLCLTMAVTGVLATSCNDMLDIPQHGSTSFDTFYKTDEEAEEAITAVYSKCAGIYFDFQLHKKPAFRRLLVRRRRTWRQCQHGATE